MERRPGQAGLGWLLPPVSVHSSTLRQPASQPAPPCRAPAPPCRAPVPLQGRAGSTMVPIPHSSTAATTCLRKKVNFSPFKK